VEGAGGPGEDFYVDLVGGSGGAPIPCGDEPGFALVVLFRGAEVSGFCAEEGGVGVVDGFAVDAKPLAHLAEALGLGGRDDAM